MSDSRTRAAITLRRAALLVAAILTACGAGPGAPLEASDLHVSAPRPGTSMSVGYLSLTNPGDVDVTITAVTSPQFERVEMHRTTLENGVSRMRPVPGLDVPAGATVQFEPGGLHLMLTGRRGDADRVMLQFRSGDALLLAVDAPLDDPVSSAPARENEGRVAQ